MAQNYDFLRSFTIDGKETKHLFQIAKVNIPFLSKDNEFFQVGNTDGKHFRNTRLGDYTLSIDGFIIKDNTGKTVPQVMDELKALVNSDEPQKLVFDIFPDRYFNAIFTGAVDYDATDLKYTPLTLTFDVPDGLAHSIEPIGFSNTYSTTTNLMLDSEYNAVQKYMKPWVKKLDEKFNNSNVVYADFTTGIPLNFERDDKTDERWLNWNPATTIHTAELKVGDEVNFSVYAKVMSIDEENDKSYAGQVILEEWDTVKGVILKRHIAYIPKKVTSDFIEYGSVVKIENENTNAINLQYGFRGSNVIKWSKPMVSFLPPLGAVVTAPTVGATAYSNSLDFGDYDYSTPPNLLPTLDYSKLSITNSSVSKPNNYIKDYGDYFVLDGNDPSASGVSRNCFVPNVTRLIKGKTYTLTITMMVDDEYANNNHFNDTAFYYSVYSSQPSGTTRPVMILTTPNMHNQWYTASKAFTVPQNISDGDYIYLQLYQNANVKGKVYIRYDIMLQEGDQTSSQAPANQMPTITTDDYIFSHQNVIKTEEEGNITNFNNLPTSEPTRNIYVRNSEGTRKLIPLLSDKKQYTMSVEMWSEKEVTPAIRYRVNDSNNTAKFPLEISNKKLPAKQWTELSVTGTINLPSNPNMAQSDYPQRWLHIAIPREYEGIIKIKNDSIKIQEGEKTTKPSWKPNLLDAPYYLSKAPLGENIANKDVQFPITTTEYYVYSNANIEDYKVNQKYVVTMKATKPSTQSFVAYLDWLGAVKAGDLTPVEGMADVWQLVFTVTQANIDEGAVRDLNIYQYPSPTKGTVKIDWLKIEKGDTRTPNIPYYKYEGIAPAPSNDPNDYHWGYSPSYINAVEYVASGDSVGDLIKIENNGTYRTKPRFSFRMKGENGLVALLNQNGAILQFGNPEDVDGNQSSRVEVGLNEDFWGNTIDPTLQVNTGFKSVYPNMNSNPATPNKIQGSLNMTSDPDSVQPIYTGVGDIGVWHGPSIVGNIQAPSNNDRTLPISTHFRFGFDNYNKEQRGRIEFSTFDELGNPIMTAIIRDSNLTSNQLIFEAWYKNTKLHEISLDRKVFSKSFYEMNMDRRGNKLIWRMVQIKSLKTNPQGWSEASIDKEYKFVWTLPEPDVSKFTKAGAWFMRYSNKFVVLMSLTDMQARWEGTPYYQDLRNYFQDGDLVEIDTATREFFINGTINNQLNVVGNQWEEFELETGETIIQPIVSDWANMAEVTAEITQNYL